MPRISQPKSDKKLLRNRRFVHTTQSDFTINDYANANKAAPSERIKKAAVNAVYSEVRSLEKKCTKVMDEPTEDEDVSWFDKELDEFDINTSEEVRTEEEETENTEDQAIASKANKKTPKRKSCKRRLSCYEDTVRYPDDLWFVLSDYIDPEDVGCFAQLCTQANRVTKTVQFWKSLYCRCCSGAKELPEYLKPLSLERIHGLRQRVIRALFYVHPLFVERTVTSTPFENEPYHLIGQRCICYWYEPVKNSNSSSTTTSKWNFNFKFKKERIHEKNCILQLRDTEENLFYGYQDLNRNTEKDCYLLQVTCQNFVAIPPVMGLALSQISLKLTQSMRFYRLQLCFDSSFKQSSGKDNSRRDNQGTVVILDPVVNLRVYPWWQPKYPHEGM